MRSQSSAEGGVPTIEFVDVCWNPILHLDYDCVGCRHAFRCNVIMNPRDQRKRKVVPSLKELDKRHRLKCATCDNYAETIVYHYADYLTCNECLVQYFDGLPEDEIVSRIREMGLPDFEGGDEGSENEQLSEELSEESVSELQLSTTLQGEQLGLF